MLAKHLFKHKKRTMFFAYHSYAQESQMRKIQLSSMKTNKHMIPGILVQMRPYSSSAAPIELKDVANTKNYKEQYLSYLKGGSSYQSILQTPHQLDEGKSESNTFNTMLQTKQDEIMLESLKVSQ